MSHVQLIPLFAGIVNLLLAILIISINPRRRLNQIFLMLGIALAWWNFGAFSLAHVDNAPDALFRARLLMMGVIFLPPLWYHFALETAGIRNRRRTVLAAYLGSVVFLALDFTPYFIVGIRHLAFGWFSVAGPGFSIFSSVFFPILCFAMITVLAKSFKTASPSTSRSMKVLFWGTLALFLGGAHDMLPVLGWDYYPYTRVPILVWGELVAACFGLLIGYSVLSDQLFEARISFSKNGAMLLRLCFLGAIAYMLLVTASIFSPATFTNAGLIASLAIMLVSAAITARFFPKLLGGLTARWEQRILGDRFEYQDKITAFIDSMPVSDDVQEQLDRTDALLFETMHLSAVGIAIVRGEARNHGQSTRPAGNAKDWPTILGATSPFLALFKTTDLAQIDCTNTFKGDATLQAARALLKSESLEAAFSISIRAKHPSGLLVIGPRRDGRPLTKSDSELIQQLCRSLAFQSERIAIIQTAELREANKAKDQFLASINHEIRNPLNGITGVAQMLAEGSTDPRQRFLLATLQACTEQLRSTMDDVLDFTRLGSEAVSIKNTEVDLLELVKTTCASYNISGELVIVKEIPSTPVFLRCDAGKLRQILSNYLANALKYGVPPGASVAVLIQKVTSEQVSVSIAVTSTGPTLSGEEIATLFTTLTRGRRAHETNAHGMGLGLALCKKLAEAMGGSVGVNSAGGETSFWFKAQFMTVADFRQPDSIGQSRYAGRRALAIEDERYNRLVLGHYLSQLGFSVAWAETGQAGLAAIIDQPVDVIFMDWFLPDMEGGELLQKIQAALAGSVPPVIVVSAYSTTAKRAECLAAGATAFVSKPIDPTKLAGALDGILLGSAPLEPQDDTDGMSMDLSPLIALKDKADVLGSFLQDLDQTRAQLKMTWRQDPQTAAFLAHRLKAQMALVRAEEATSLMDLLEQALNEKWPADNIEKLVENIESNLDRVSAHIRHRETLVN
jgi:signal transduction histidine kinase/CheY-like chemotaxis protein